MTLAASYYLSLVSGRTSGLWPALLRSGLWAASLPYGWVSGCRNGLYDRGWQRSYRADVPVVSVGNLTLGGTGKTPCVEHVARICQQKGRRVAILSRGYGKQASAAGLRLNDEALVIRDNLPGVPHLQGADRASLARVAVVQLGCDVLVLDDGFQHRRLARDLDIVLIDATDPWGHGHLFPRGLLRESPARLKDASLVLLTRCDLVRPMGIAEIRCKIARLAPGVPVAESTHRPVEWISSTGMRAPLAMAASRPVLAFCGIGNPDAFRATLHGLDITPADFRAFSDHHDYRPTDVADLESRARRLPADGIVVTTQKDLVKLRQPRLADRELWALRIGLHVNRGQEELDRKLEAVLGGKLPAPH